MSRFPWFESLLVVALAVALIVKPQTRVVSAASQKFPPVSRLEKGETKKLGDGSVCSWVKVDQNGEPIVIGVTLTEAALNNLPTTGDRGLASGQNEALLRLPAYVAASPFTHIAVNWDPDSHVITRAYLLTKPEMPEASKQPVVYPAGVFPASYSVKYDPQTHEYTIALEDLKRH